MNEQLRCREILKKVMVVVLGMGLIVGMTACGSQKNSSSSNSSNSASNESVDISDVDSILDSGESYTISGLPCELQFFEKTITLSGVDLYVDTNNRLYGIVSFDCSNLSDDEVKSVTSASMNQKLLKFLYVQTDTTTDKWEKMHASSNMEEGKKLEYYFISHAFDNAEIINNAQVRLDVNVYQYNNELKSDTYRWIESVSKVNPQPATSLPTDTMAIFQHYIELLNW